MVRQGIILRVCRPFGTRIRLIVILLFMAACTRWMFFTPFSLKLDYELRNSKQDDHRKVRWRDAENVEAIWERNLREERNPHDINVIDWRRLSSMIRSVMETNQSMKIALVNIQEEEAHQWATLGETKVIKFDVIDSEEVHWTDLFPEWIDEEEQYTTPACPAIPMPEIEDETKFDSVITRVPCRKPEKGWSTDVVR